MWYFIVIGSLFMLAALLTNCKLTRLLPAFLNPFSDPPLINSDAPDFTLQGGKVGIGKVKGWSGELTADSGALCDT
jgi:hypothetical protein